MVAEPRSAAAFFGGGDEAMCKNCTNTGTDLLGQPCICAAGKAEGQASVFQPAPRAKGTPRASQLYLALSQDQKLVLRYGEADSQAGEQIGDSSEPSVSDTVIDKLLKSSRPKDRILAVQHLRRRGARAAPHDVHALMQLLDDTGMVRRIAAEALLHLDSCFDSETEDRQVNLEKVHSTLSQLLKHCEVYVRRRTAEQLGLLGKSAATHVDDLLGLLQDEDSGTQMAAAGALMKLKVAGVVEHLGPAHKLISKHLSSPLQSVRVAAAMALGQLGAPALPHAGELVELCRTRGSARGSTRGSSRGSSRSAASEENTAALDWETRQAAATSLLRLKAAGVDVPTEPPHKAFASELESQFEAARCGAAAALGELGEAAEQHIPRLAQIFRDQFTGEALRRSTGAALLRLQGCGLELHCAGRHSTDIEVEEIVAYFERQLADIFEQPRCLAADTLGAVGPAAARHRRMLTELLTQAPGLDEGIVGLEIFSARACAAAALLRLHAAGLEVSEESAHKVFQRLLESSQVSDRLAALERLRRLGAAGEPQMEAVIALFRNVVEEPKVRAAAFQVIQELRFADVDVPGIGF